MLDQVSHSSLELVVLDGDCVDVCVGGGCKNGNIQFLPGFKFWSDPTELYFVEAGSAFS